ncbi:MAG: universal stress protein [Roseiflexaceae bacterium]|nr:universal stress protein [Roseiflexaceae bacterium]
MSRIFVPLDGSPLAVQVLPYVRMFANLLGAEVHLTHVVTHGNHYRLALGHGIWDELQSKNRPNSATTDDLSKLRENAHTYLEQQAAPLRDAGITVGTSVLEGRPEEAIVGAAEDSLMIVMTTHGYSGVRRWALGSTTDKVVHASSVPVFVVHIRPQSTVALRRILVPLDGSEIARRALPMAIKLARSSGAEIVLLAVVPPPIGGIEVALTPVVLDDRDRAAIHDRLLSEVISIGGDSSGLKITPMVVEGFVAEEINDEAERSQADLIVMSSHGYGGWRRLALGNVTDKVMHITRTPLLVIHGAE